MKRYSQYNILARSIAVASIAFALVLIPSGLVRAEEAAEEAMLMSVAATTSTAAGYGGECTIPVTPPSGGFGLSASPIYREWWDYWSSPKVWLGISGGDAYEMKVSDRSDFSSGYKGPYATGMKWKVYRPDREGWKTIYVKFYSSCGKESPTISKTYYYWGW